MSPLSEFGSSTMIGSRSTVPSDRAEVNRGGPRIQPSVLYLAARPAAIAYASTTADGRSHGDVSATCCRERGYEPASGRATHRAPHSALVITQ